MAGLTYADAVYSDQERALALALGLARTDDADTMRMLLTITAGKVGGLTHHRPFYAAMKWLKSNPEHVRVLGGGSDRLEYESPLLSHAELGATQGAEDSRLKLEVPPEYAVRLAQQPRRFAGISR